MLHREDFRLGKPVADATYMEFGQRKPLHAVYVCSPYRATATDEKTAEAQRRQNIHRAKLASKLVIKMGYMPMTPHLYFPQFLDDDNPDERNKGINYGLLWLEQCDEVWAFGEVISEGMAAEITRAKALGIPVKMMPEPETVIEKIINYFRGKEFEKYGKTE